MTYLTDGQKLYEVVGQQADKNFGRTGGFIRSTIIRDCVSEEVGSVDDLRLMTFSEVEDMEQAA